MKSIVSAALFCLSWLPGTAWAVDCETVAQGSIRATVCRVDPAHDRLQLFLRDDQDQMLGGFDAIDDWLKPSGQRLLFAMNAGMFRPDRSPSGLCVADGHELAPLETRSGRGNFFLKPNGVFFLDAAGAHVMETAEYVSRRRAALLATQSGPLLLRHGRIHPAFHAQSDSRLIRNGVGVRADGVAVFAISDTPVNFHEFAALFRDQLHCPDALYLDGNVSVLLAASLGRRDAAGGLGPIIGVSGAR